MCQSCKALCSYYNGNLGLVTPYRVIVKLPFKKRLTKMRTFEYVCIKGAYSRQQPLCCVAKREIKSDFKRGFYSYIKEIAHYDLVIILRFYHR